MVLVLYMLKVDGLVIRTRLEKGEMRWIQFAADLLHHVLTHGRRILS